MALAGAGPAMAESGSGSDGDGGGGGDNSGSGGGGGEDGGGNDDVDDDGDGKAKKDNDGKRQKARNAGGGHAKLSDILNAVRKRYPGEVVNVKLIKGEAGPVYRVKLIDESGRLLTLSVDGRSRRILKVSGG